MTRDELIPAIRESRARWDEAVTAVPAERLEERGVHGEWSVKDVVAHVSWFEREMIGVIEARALVGSDLWLLSATERNDAIYRENEGRPLAEVLHGAEAAIRRLEAGLETLTDEELAELSRFADMPADWIPWEIIAQNTFEHYDAHRVALQAWLKKK